MSRSQRLALLGAAAVVAVAAVLIIGVGSEDQEADEPRPATQPRPVTGGPRTTSTSTTTTAPRRPAPDAVIRVVDGLPVGGIRRVSVGSGEPVRIVVRSDDTGDEVHVHGYDLTKDLAPGRPVTFAFEARIEGVFEVELEGSKTQIAKLSVEP